MLDKNFKFTQSSIGTFIECPMKFKLKYIDKLFWNVEDELEEKLKRGREFHLLAERYFKGIDSSACDIEKSLLEDFEKLKESYPIKENWRYYSEYDIKQDKGEMKLSGKFDLIIVKPQNKIEIVDFKTNEKELSQERVEGSIQTKVYLYLLWNNIEKFNINKSKIKEMVMSYYQVSVINKNKIVKYDKDKNDEYEKEIKKYINKIKNTDYKTLVKSTGKKCLNCEIEKKCKKT